MRKRRYPGAANAKKTLEGAAKFVYKTASPTVKKVTKATGAGVKAYLNTTQKAADAISKKFPQTRTTRRPAGRTRRK